MGLVNFILNWNIIVPIDVIDATMTNETSHRPNIARLRKLFDSPKVPNLGKNKGKMFWKHLERKTHCEKQSDQFCNHQNHIILECSNREHFSTRLTGEEYTMESPKTDPAPVLESKQATYSPKYERSRKQTSRSSRCSIMSTSSNDGMHGKLI